MTIEIDDKSYIVGMWFSSCPKTDNNWLACVIRDPEHPTRYKAWSRFRYVKDSTIWDSDDEKSWTTFTSQEGVTDEEMMQFMDLAQNMEHAYSEKDKIIVQGDINKMMELAKGKPWMHMKAG